MHRTMPRGYRSRLGLCGGLRGEVPFPLLDVLSKFFGAVDYRAGGRMLLGPAARVLAQAADVR